MVFSYPSLVPCLGNNTCCLFVSGMNNWFLRLTLFHLCVPFFGGLFINMDIEQKSDHNSVKDNIM